MNTIDFKKPDPYWKIQKVKLYADIGVFTSVVEFANGMCHIVVDKGCWRVVNSGRFTALLTPYSLDILKKLPSDPYDYKPYLDSLDIPKE